MPRPGGAVRGPGLRALPDPVSSHFSQRYPRGEASASCGDSAVLRAALLGGVLGIPMVAGEELGWRAFLAPRLECSGLNRPILMGGVIWAAWHAPLIITGQYAAGPIPLVAVLSFSVLAVSLHCLWTRWYSRTGSLWPAIVGHAATGRKYELRT